MDPCFLEALLWPTDIKRAVAKRFSLPRASNATTAALSAPPLKRRMGYFDEQLSATRAKLDVMQVDDDSCENGAPTAI